MWPRWLRPRLRALRHVPHGYLQHPRRAPVPENRRQLRALICFPKPEDSLSSGFSFRRGGRGFPSFGSTNSPKIFIKPGFFCGRTEASAPTEFPKIFCFCAGEVRQKSGRCGHTSRVEGRLIGGFSAKSMYHGRTLSICSLMCILPNQFSNYFRYKSFIF